MKILNAIIAKEIKILVRDPGSLVLLFFLPAAFIMILSISLQGVFSTGSNEKLDILFVDEDDGKVGEKISKGLEETQNFRIIKVKDGKKVTFEEAKTLLKRKKYKIAIRIPQGSSKAASFEGNETIEVFLDPGLSRMVEDNFKAHLKSSIYAIEIGNLKDKIEEFLKKVEKIENQSEDLREKIEKLGQAMIKLKEANEDLLNTNNQLSSQCEKIGKLLSKLQLMSKKNIPIAGQAEPNYPDYTQSKSLIYGKPARSKNPTNKASIDESILKIASETPEKIEQNLKPTLIDSNIKGLSLKHGSIFQGAPETMPSSVQQTVPGWTLFALFWIAQILAMNILAERQTGAYRRFLVTPAGRIRYFSSKIIPFFALNMLQAGVMFSIGAYILPMLGADSLKIHNLLPVSLITIAFSLVSIGFGFLIASLSKTIVMSAILSATMAVVMAAVGGIMVPRFVMPGYLQKACFFVPHGWALEAYLDVLVRGHNIEDVILHIAVLFIFAIVTFAFAFFHPGSLKESEW